MAQSDRLKEPDLAEPYVAPAKEPLIMERLGRIEDMDRTFDIAFWQALCPDARFDAAWELVEDAQMIKGRDPDALRFDRTVASLQRRPR